MRRNDPRQLPRFGFTSDPLYGLTLLFNSAAIDSRNVHADFIDAVTPASPLRRL
jgi:hypothetical protein